MRTAWAEWVLVVLGGGYLKRGQQCRGHQLACVIKGLLPSQQSGLVGDVVLRRQRIRVSGCGIVSLIVISVTGILALQFKCGDIFRHAFVIQWGRPDVQRQQFRNLVFNVRWRFLKQRQRWQLKRYGLRGRRRDVWPASAAS